MTFLFWLQKSGKPVPGNSISWLSALVPEVDKTNPRKLDLMIFWPWLQKSTKQWFSFVFNDPENSSWETVRIAMGNEKYAFCLMKQWFSWIFARNHQELLWMLKELPRAARSYQEHPGAAKSSAPVPAQWEILEYQSFCNICPIVVKYYLVGTGAPLMKKGKKTTTPKLVLMCKPNEQIMKLVVFCKVNMVFGWHQVLVNNHDDERHALEDHGFIKAEWDFLAKLMILPQHDAIEGKTITSRITVIKKNKIQQYCRENVWAISGGSKMIATMVQVLTYKTTEKRKMRIFVRYPLSCSNPGWPWNPSFYEGEINVAATVSELTWGAPYMIVAIIQGLLYANQNNKLKFNICSLHSLFNSRINPKSRFSYPWEPDVAAKVSELT